ncbi:GH25238 [Drosophila grimshawi]|uniref:GH25238 n=1 Tax=Drosophila grimshawi TaxID=7222 RepID=B4K0Q9_DROGR|nr:GH25238 [Drosophila grimshawi]
MSRNVLAPHTQRMSHNRNHRVHVVHDYFGGSKWNCVNQTTAKGYEEPDLYADEDFEEDGTDCNVEELSNGSYKLALHVPKSFYGSLIGFKGATKRRIELETQTEIYVPRQNEISTDLVIQSKERSNVCAALRKIRLLIESLRKRMRPTHFLDVALNSGGVQQRFLKLKQNNLDAQLPGIDQELFIPASDNNDPDSIKLHMTLLNSRYTNKKPNKNESNSFDAREILKRFGDYDFGKAQCNEVHMCVCKSYCEGDDFYKTTGSLKF